MHSHGRMVVGVFSDRASADHCYQALLARGYTDSEINLMVSERTRDLYWKPLSSEKEDQRHKAAGGGESRSLEGIGVGGAVGTAIGSSLAALAAIGTSLIIPGLNVVVAGPIAAALAGGGAGAVTGGLVGGLVGLGMSSEETDAYHTALRDGGTILGVEVHENDDVESVERLIRSCAGEQVHCCTT